MIYFFCSAYPSCSQGWHFHNNSCFYINAQTPVSSWDKARIQCVKGGAQLAIIEDQSTLRYLQNLAEGAKVGDWYPFFIGATATGNAKWRWITGELVSPTAPWGPDEPSGDGVCGTIMKSSGWVGHGWKLNDENCNWGRGFVCEKMSCKFHSESNFKLNRKPMHLLL